LGLGVYYYCKRRKFSSQDGGEVREDATVQTIMDFETQMPTETSTIVGA
jgi:hypothetical protein